MRYRAHLALVFAVLAASPAYAAGGWTVARDAAGTPVMEETIGPVSLLLRASEGDGRAGAQEFRITVDRCKDIDWSMSDVFNLDNDDAAGTKERLTEEVKLLLTNAHLNCAFPEADDSRFMSGLDAAAARYEELN